MRPTSEETGPAINCVARVRISPYSSSLRFSGWSARTSTSPGPSVRRTSLKSSARTSAAGSGGSELSSGCSRSTVPERTHRHLVRLSRHANSRLRFDIEERFDPASGS